MKIKKLVLTATTLSFVFLGNAYARSDQYAPIGVMGDHVHASEKLMLSYRLMEMQMDDLYKGDSKIDYSDLRGEYMMTPTDMQMKMHMLGAMYGFNAKHTLMVMAPYIENNMNMINTMTGAVSNMKSEGLGDIKVSDLISLDTMGWMSTLNLGVSLPTGSIKKQKNGVRLPYRMQLGSGTYDPFVGFTQVKHMAKGTFGYQVKATLRLGQNTQNYSMGEKYEGSLWYSHILCERVSSSLRVNVSRENNIDGKDTQIETGMTNPARRSFLTGRMTASLGAGLSYDIPGLEDSRLSIEYMAPLYQKLDGPQLGIDNVITIGLQKSF